MCNADLYNDSIELLFEEGLSAIKPSVNSSDGGTSMSYLTLELDTEFCIISSVPSTNMKTNGIF